MSIIPLPPPQFAVYNASFNTLFRHPVANITPLTIFLLPFYSILPFGSQDKDRL
jgi:hypothetical protein